MKKFEENEKKENNGKIEKKQIVEKLEEKKIIRRDKWKNRRERRRNEVVTMILYKRKS